MGAELLNSIPLQSGAAEQAARHSFHDMGGHHASPRDTTIIIVVVKELAIATAINITVQIIILAISVMIIAINKIRCKYWRYRVYNKVV